MAEKKKELGRRQLSMPTKIIIVLFAVIMALSMMLPSLASFFASSSTESAQTEEKAEETTEEKTDAKTADDAEGASDESAEGAEDAAEKGDEQAEAGDAEAEDKQETTEYAGGAVPNNETLKTYAEKNSKRILDYVARLEEDPDNLAALLNVAQSYMSWGYNAQYVSQNDEEKAYSNGLVNKAVEYFDRYLALHDSKSVRVDKDLCLYYLDRADEAVADLEAFSEESPDYPLVWANLGMLYEMRGETERANEAYKKAAETDPDNTYGAKDYANGRIIDLNAKVSSPADAGEASVENLSTAPESGLTSKLAEGSGVGF